MGSKRIASGILFQRKYLEITSHGINQATNGFTVRRASFFFERIEKFGTFQRINILALASLLLQICEVGVDEVLLKPTHFSSKVIFHYLVPHNL